MRKAGSEESPAGYSDPVRLETPVTAKTGSKTEAGLAENPLRLGIRVRETAEPCVVVLFGASGDLTRRKLVPAIFRLWQKNLLSPSFALIGFSRSKMDTDQFRDAMRKAIIESGETDSITDTAWESFSSCLYYEAGEARDDSFFKNLLDRVHSVDREKNCGGSVLYYLSTPPSLFEEIIEQLGKFKLAAPEHGWARVVIEKPFGRDLESAMELNRKLSETFLESQIYRIDHFLGKETVQNILVFRFANGIFEPIWNRRYIDHIQITSAEELGVGARAGYYEESGALRDMIQNHMLQLLSLVAMDPPVSLEPDDVRDEKVRVAKAIRPFDKSEVMKAAVHGQYTRGIIGGNDAPGYIEERGVNPKSTTETYAAVKFIIDNWRWAGVPFYVRSGKRLPKRVTEVAIQFKSAPQNLFGRSPESLIEANQLILRIQPDEGITLRFGAKLPDIKGHTATRIRQVNMDFLYGTAFAQQPPEAYERLLYDAMIGDSTLFARRDMVEIAWSLVDPILDAWKESKPEDMPGYEAGSWGPAEADKLIAECGERWRRP